MKALPVQLSQEELSALFEYKDGALYWRHRHGGKLCRPAGTKAGTPLGDRGYLRVSVNRKFYYVHRLIWAMHYGSAPDILDHIDGNPANNTIENLRPTTHSGNMRNSKLNKRNTSGIKGVALCKKLNKWVGEVYANGTRHRTAYFLTPEECGKAVEKLRKQLHGDFARHATAT
jgi:hypothetical protein